jgi:uncharacterized protein YndB with AHSA1/START domain
VTVFETQREVGASPDAVFRAFEDGSTLSSWWGPAGFSNAFETHEFRAGGVWKFVMRGPDGKNYPNESTFLEITRPGRIVVRHLSEPKFTLTVSISQSGTGSVDRWSQQFDSEEVSRAVAHFVTPANEQNLDRLEAVLAGR